MRSRSAMTRKEACLSMLLAFSALSFWALVAPNSKLAILLCALAGVLSALAALRAKKEFNAKRLAVGCAAAIALFTSYRLCAVFADRWKASAMLSALADRLSLTPARLALFVGLILSACSLPFLEFILVGLLSGIVRCYQHVNVRELLGELRSAFLSKKAVQYYAVLAANIVLFAVVGTLLMLGIYTLPTERIEEHVAESAQVFLEEGTYPDVFRWCQSRLDNYTDALILLEAADSTEAPLLDKALLNYHGWVEGLNPAEGVAEHYIHAKAFDGIGKYARYWHGYHILIKPLLLLTNYQTIRILNGAVQLLLIAFAAYLFSKRRRIDAFLPLLLSYLLLMPVVLAKSFQYSSCFYIFAVSSIVILRSKATDEKQRVFLYAGIATAFFDFLTYPIATFGVPAAIDLSCRYKDRLENKLSAFVRQGFSWGAGYAGMWAAKWIIASIATDENVIADALEEVMYRTSNQSYEGKPPYLLSKCISSNLSVFFRTPVTWLVIALLWIFCFLIVRNVWKGSVRKGEILVFLTPYVLVGILPILWYAFATNHSSMHYWFTNKALVVTVVAVMCGLIDLNKWIEEGKNDGSHSRIDSLL